MELKTGSSVVSSERAWTLCPAFAGVGQWFLLVLLWKRCHRRARTEEFLQSNSSRKASLQHAHGVHPGKPLNAAAVGRKKEKRVPWSAVSSVGKRSVPECFPLPPHSQSPVPRFLASEGSSQFKSRYEFMCSVLWQTEVPLTLGGVNRVVTGLSGPARVFL